MAKEKKEKIVTLESVLWNCRVALRGVGGTDKNRDAVIGLVFIKFATDKFNKRRAEIIAEYGDNPIFLEKKSFYLSQNIYYLNEKSRWDFLVENANESDIAVKIDKAMADIESTNPVLKGTLPVNIYATLGASNKSIKNLINEISRIDENKFDEEDIIGRTYEYFLKAYAAAGKKEDGEFYTPASVVQLIAELIEPYDGKVYDPCCGSGGMFVQSMKFVERHNGNKTKVSVIGQESQQETWRLCKMNLAIRGIAHDLGEKNASSFTDDLHKDVKVDYIMANPPFNLKAWRGEDELLKDPRFNGFAVPPVSNANYAWILHMLSKLDETNGIAGFLLANGALNAEGEEYSIRKELIERDKIEAIIVLPRDMFYTTDISVTLWIMNNNKSARELNGRKLRDRKHEILFMDLRTWNSNVEKIDIDKGKSKKKVTFNEEQIKDIKKIYNGWQDSDASLYSDIPELCKSVTLEELKNNNFTLTPSKYIEFIDHDLDIDYEKEMTRIQKEMQEIVRAERESQDMLETAFGGIGYGIG